MVIESLTRIKEPSRITDFCIKCLLTAKPTLGVVSKLIKSNYVSSYLEEIGKCFSALNLKEKVSIIGLMVKSSSNKKCLKFTEALILSLYESSPLVSISSYTDFAVESGQIKFMERAKDLIDLEASNSISSNQPLRLMCVL